MLRYGQKYVDAGASYYESQYRQRALRNAKRRAAQLGTNWFLNPMGTNALHMVFTNRPSPARENSVTR